MIWAKRAQLVEDKALSQVLEYCGRFLYTIAR